MPILDDLKAASADSVTLNEFINESFQELYDYFTWRTDEELSGHLNSIREYITRKRTVLLQLPPTDYNLSFLALLLEVSERLSLASPFGYLYKFLQKNNFEVGARLHASSRFLIDVDNANVYRQRFDKIYDYLESAINDELDNSDKVITTIVNYYVKAIADFGKFYIILAKHIKSKISKIIAEDETSFLNRPIIWDVLKTDLGDIESAQIHIHQLLDEFLQRGIDISERVEGYLVEDETDYATELKSVEADFDEIRQISLEHYRYCNGDEIYNSLHRGVQIITNEPQLFGYMYSFGKMHYSKLYEAFASLQDNLFDNHLNIVDWGCGQGMATMVLMEYLRQKGITLNDAHVLLIEPSELALKRAAIHVKKFDSDIKIATINKDLDSLESKDFKYLHGTSHLHLFSNILDVDLFSLTQLINSIKTRFSGLNYFIIVSPYVNDTKKNRIDSFVKAFSSHKDFSLLSTNTNAKNTWEGSWTRIERVFCVVVQ